MFTYPTIYSFPPSQHWSHFSPSVAPLPGLAQQGLRFNGMSASPEMSETTTPPSFEGALRGPSIRATQDELMLPPGDVFASSADDHWTNGLEEFPGKLDEVRHTLLLFYFVWGSLSPGRHMPPSNSRIFRWARTPPLPPRSHFQAPSHLLARATDTPIPPTYPLTSEGSPTHTRTPIPPT